MEECKDWADKMAALASYAKQSDDQTLYNAAVRIKARAIRRCGELLREIDPAKGGQPHQRANSTRGGAPPSRMQAAREAGLSDDQRKTALRVAGVPRDEFEALVESATPPTVTELAERGTQKRKPIIDLDGIDPTDHIASTRGQGADPARRGCPARITLADVCRIVLPLLPLARPLLRGEGSIPRARPALPRSAVCWRATRRWHPAGRRA